ncbi:MAG: helix-turn-helix transcriptional regulator [Erysipelotrichales bacterium]|nr:helix-turn-helix transcriptional regulator [Erysipelotrichales bacterium]
MTDIECFAKNLKYLRQLHQLKQDDIATIFNVTSQAVSKWETARSLPDIKTLMKISEYFKVTIEELLSQEIEYLSKSENNKENNKNTADDKSEIEMPKQTTQRARYHAPRLRDDKQTKTFLIYNLVCAILSLLSLITLIVPLDIISIIVVIILAIVNIIGSVNYIRTIIKIKHHVLIQHEAYAKWLKLIAPVNLVAAMWFMIAIIIFMDTVDLQGMIAYYSVFLFVYMLLGIGACIANVLYHKAEQNLIY